MYLPPSFRIDEPAQLAEFVHRYPFATLLGHDGEQPVATAAPVLLRHDAEGRPLLVTHLARANDHWRVCDGERRGAVLFHGPHAYITPRWYATQPSVPTWNYALVEAVGRPQAIHDPDWLRELLAELMARFDPDLALPDELVERLLPAIVGLAMPVEAWHGKFKLGQNRSAEDLAGVLAGLSAASAPDAAALAAFMRVALGLES